MFRSFGQRRPSTVSACWGPSTAQPAPPRRRVGRFDHRERARLDWTPRYGGRDVETSGKSLEELAPPSLPGLSCCDASLLEDDPSFAAAVASTDELLLRADPQFQL